MSTIVTVTNVQKGDRLQWYGVSIRVTRVSKTGAWADVDCNDGHERWSKRQALPFPAGTVRVGGGR
jgi:hypothetical protein